MATTTTQAGGEGATSNWTLAAGASKTAAVNQPDDDATSYIQSGTSLDTYQYFTCTPALTTGDTITEISITARCRRGGANDVYIRIGYTFTPNGGGTQTGEVANTTLQAVSAWGNLTYTHSGLSVVWGSGLEFWIRNAQARQTHCTTLYVQITYTAAAGGGVMKLTLPVRVNTLVGGQLAA